MSKPAAGFSAKAAIGLVFAETPANFEPVMATEKIDYIY